MLNGRELLILIHFAHRGNIVLLFYYPTQLLKGLSDFLIWVQRKKTILYE